MNSNHKFIRKINSNGMTLIEVIVSLAIVGIIATVFLPLFSNGFKLLIGNGKQMQKMYGRQDTTEQEILKGINKEDIKSGGVTLIPLIIVFPDKTIDDIEGVDSIEDSYNTFIINK